MKDYDNAVNITETSCGFASSKESTQIVQWNE